VNDTENDTAPRREIPVPETTIAALRQARAEMDARFARREFRSPDGAAPLIVVIDETQEVLRRPATVEARALAAHILADLRLEAFAEEVTAERHRQLTTWGDQRHPDGTGGRRARDACNYVRNHTESNAVNGALTWHDILKEEVFEAFAESDPDRLRAELIQVAAVAAAWIYDIDRREPKPGQAAPVSEL